MKIRTKRLIQSSEPIPVYDITVSEDNLTSNYELASGVVSKNSDFLSDGIDVYCLLFSR